MQASMLVLKFSIGVQIIYVYLFRNAFTGWSHINLNTISYYLVCYLYTYFHKIDLVAVSSNLLLKKLFLNCVIFVFTSALLPADTSNYCLWKDQIHSDGTIWSDECNLCICIKGRTQCTKVSDSVVYI